MFFFLSILEVFKFDVVEVREGSPVPLGGPWMLPDKFWTQNVFVFFSNGLHFFNFISRQQ